MKVNVKMDLFDISNIIQTINDIIVDKETSIISEETSEYIKQLKEAVYTYKTALEEELLRYKSDSYEAFQINKVMLKIEEVLHG